MLELSGPERCPLCGTPGHNCGAGHEPRDMISIPREVTKTMSTHVALEHIYALDANGEPASVAYAPGEKVKPEDIESLLAEGAALGDSSLEGDALRAAIASVKAAREAGEEPPVVETKDVRGPKDEPKTQGGKNSRKRSAAKGNA